MDPFLKYLIGAGIMVYFIVLAEKANEPALSFIFTIFLIMFAAAIIVSILDKLLKIPNPYIRRVTNTFLFLAILISGLLGFFSYYF